jgi:hypothetical protein
LFSCSSPPGLGTDQLVGTYGERAVAGSDIDFTNLTEESSFPADPNPEEQEFLSSVTNLSPGCGAEFCQEFDIEGFRALKPDFIIMHGYRQAVWGLDDRVTEIEAAIGKPIIYIDISLEGPECKEGSGEDRCYGKSLIEVIAQYEVLAVALGIDIPASVDEDRRRLCQASATFQEIARDAHLRGVRALAAYFSPPEGGDFGTLNYFANPPDDLVLRMLEELGLPLLHVSCNSPGEEGCDSGYFWESISTQEFFNNCTSNLEACNDQTHYPVDFWLYDHRESTMVKGPNFFDAFPDKAIGARQFAYWPIGAGTVSYRHAAEILELIAPALDKADRLHPSTSCTPGVDVSGIAHRVVGLEGGEYACYDEKFHRQAYFECPASRNSESGLGGGAMAGIVIGAVVGFAVLVLVILKSRKTRHTASEKESSVTSGEEFPTGQIY